MSRRLIALAATALLVGPLLPASAADPVELPRANCTKRFTDNSGDTGLPVPATAVKSLDMTAFFVRTTATQFQAFIKLVDISAPADMQSESAYKYNFLAKVNGKTLTFNAVQKSTFAPWTVVTTTAATPTANTGGGTENALPGFTATVDPTTDWVTFTAPRDRLEQNVGGPLVDGDKITGIVVTSDRFIENSPQQYDSYTGTLTEWTIGDEYCFGPPPAALSDLVAPAVQFSDTATLSAKLVNEAGAALAGKKVEFSVEGDKRPPVVGTTNAEGIATAKYVATGVGAGTRKVTAFFPGDTTDGKATLAGTIKISTEPTAFAALAVAKPSATTRYVTATLLDNDKKPVAGQAIAWYVNGKKVATGKTDAKGKAVYKSAKPTQTVQAKYTGLAGKYGASSSKSVRV